MITTSTWILLMVGLVMLFSLLFLIMKLNSRNWQLTIEMNRQNQKIQENLRADNQNLLNLAVAKNLETYSQMTAIVSPISTSNTQYDMNRNDDFTEAFKSGEHDFSSIELESLAQVGLL